MQGVLPPVIVNFDWTNDNHKLKFSLLQKKTSFILDADIISNEITSRYVVKKIMTFVPALPKFVSKAVKWSIGWKKPLTLNEQTEHLLKTVQCQQVRASCFTAAVGIPGFGWY